MSNSATISAVSQMGLKFEGNCADYHLMEAIEYSKSIEGAAKLYRLVAHYCIHGVVLKTRERTELKCYAYPAKAGSFDSSLAIITGLAAEVPMFAGVYKDALNWLISKIMGHLKKSLSGGAKVDELIGVIKTHAESDKELQSVLSHGLIKANDNLASLQDKLIDSLPNLIAAAQKPYADMLLPVGKSCNQMSQFHELEEPVSISLPEAEAIRSGGDIKLGDPNNYTITKIHSLNLDSGAAVIDVLGMEGSIKAKITDMMLTQPDNAYSKALNLHLGLTVRARPAFRDDVISKLYITESYT